MGVMISIDHVTKRFPSVTAVDGVSLNIEKQEFFGLLGPNGAGKSTLMSLLTGYQNADSGSITIDGREVTPDSLGIREEIGFVPQSLAIYDEMSAQENLEMFGGLFTISPKQLKERIESQLNAVGLFERRKDRVKTFSGGMKRRLNLIASLLHDPQVLLCDEPTVGVDPQSRNAIFDFLEGLKKDGKTIVYTTHYMEEAERLCDRVAIIDHGTIIALGTTDELLDKLPYDETVIVTKNQFTMAKRKVFEQFGELRDNEDHIELLPKSGFALSRFFESLEQNNLKYSWVELHRPTLEALFLRLTGRTLRD